MGDQKSTVRITFSSFVKVILFDLFQFVSFLRKSNLHYCYNGEKLKNLTTLSFHHLEKNFKNMLVIRLNYSHKRFLNILHKSIAERNNVCTLRYTEGCSHFSLNIQ